MDRFLTRKSLLSISLLLMIVQPQLSFKSENKIILKKYCSSWMLVETGKKH